MKVEWSVFKKFVDERKLSIQWVDLDKTYWLKAFDGPFSLECELAKYMANARMSADAASLQDFEQNYKAAGNKPIAQAIAPFASKNIGTSSLFKRVVGIQKHAATGTNEVIYSVPFKWAKLMAIEVIGGDVGDHVSMWVLAPNGMNLNQFGYNVSVAKDYYVQKSEFDADIFMGLQLKVVYHNVGAPKVIGINFVMNEVK